MDMRYLSANSPAGSQLQQQQQQQRQLQQQQHQPPTHFNDNATPKTVVATLTVNSDAAGDNSPQQAVGCLHLKCNVTRGIRLSLI
jgi:hypothetical protein